MIIVLEGPDGGGKTTLAELIHAAVGEDYQYLHDAYSPDQFQQDTELLVEAVRGHLAGLTVVLDRHWVGDNVYGAVFRGRGGLWVRRCDSVLQRYGACYVLCCPPVDALEAEFQRLREQREEKFNTMREVACRYLDLWHGNIVRPFDGDYVELMSNRYPWSTTPGRYAWLYDRFTLDSMTITRRYVRRVLLPATREAARQATGADPLLHELSAWELSGSLLYCRALLVGERAADPDVEPAWPFYYGDRQSAGYLNAALHRAKVDETHVALTNARSAVGNLTDNCNAILRWLRDNRPEVRIIALGREAEKVIRYHGHRVDASLPHPQWVRRFDHGGDYHKQLETAVYDQ